MREIKFRFWLKGYLMGIRHLNPTVAIIDMPWEWDAVDQFTGLTDKNGREIYEGDIIRTGDAISFVWFGYGKFNEAYYTENYKFDEPMLIDRDLSDFCDYTEVIGNIYENPELLNVPSEKGE